MYWRRCLHGVKCGVAVKTSLLVTGMFSVDNHLPFDFMGEMFSLETEIRKIIV
jgi:hypothetical protein